MYKNKLRQYHDYIANYIDIGQLCGSKHNITAKYRYCFDFYRLLLLQLDILFDYFMAYTDTDYV